MEIGRTSNNRSYLSAAVLLCGDRCGRKIKKALAAPAADRLWTALETAKEKTGNPDLSIDVEKIQEKVHMEYDEVQADAIRKAAVSKVMVLTGGPGTGKTTTTQGIIATYRAFGLKILLAAPTGRAAKRMTEATGLEAKNNPSSSGMSASGRISQKRRKFAGRGRTDR